MDIYEKKYLKYKKKYLNLKQFGSADVVAKPEKPAESEEIAETTKSEEPAKSAKPEESVEPAESAEPIDVVKFGTYQEQYLGVKFNGKIYYVDGFEIKTFDHADAPELFKSKNIGDFKEDEKVKYGMLLIHVNTDYKYDDEKFDENLNSLELKLDDVSKFMQQLEIFKFMNDKDIYKYYYTFSDRPLIIKNLNEKYEESLKNKFELMLTLKTLKNLKDYSFQTLKINDSIMKRQVKIPESDFLKEIDILKKLKNFKEKSERDKNIDIELNKLKNEVPKIDSAKFEKYKNINERKFTKKERNREEELVRRRSNWSSNWTNEEFNKKVNISLEEKRTSKKNDFIKEVKDEIINIKNLIAIGFKKTDLLRKNEGYHGSEEYNYKSYQDDIFNSPDSTDSKKKSEELEEKLSYIRENRIVENGVVKEGEIDKMIKTVKQLEKIFLNSYFTEEGIKLDEKSKNQVFELYKNLIDEDYDINEKEKIHSTYGTKLKQYLKFYQQTLAS
jgi:hypothetical protein